MRIVWRVELPEPIGGFAGMARAPLHWDGERLWLPTEEFLHPREVRAHDPEKRGCRARVFRFDADGGVDAHSFAAYRADPASGWSFLELGDRLILHRGVFHELPGGQPIRALTPVSAGLGHERLIHCFHEDRFIYVSPGRRCALHCHDVATLEPKWSVQYENTEAATPPVVFADDRVFCFARDVASSIDLATGEIIDRWSLPRIVKLYPPTEYEGDLLFPYANRKSGGLLRFDPVREKMVWKRPQRTMPDLWINPLAVAGRIGILSLNEGQVMVGIDLDSGEERWRFRAGLSTEIDVRGDSIVFGTGRMTGHHLRRHDVKTGETEWKVALKYGCEGFVTVGDDLVVGDFNGILRRVRASDGEVTEKLRTGGPLSDPFACAGDRLFALRLGKRDEDPSSVIAVDL